jgi:hypothetical protein
VIIKVKISIENLRSVDRVSHVLVQLEIDFVEVIGHDLPLAIVISTSILIDWDMHLLNSLR